MKRYSHENWNRVLALPDSKEKELDMKLIGHMSVGNLMWFVRRVIAMDKDVGLAERFGEKMIEPTQFTKRRRIMEKEASERS